MNFSVDRFLPARPRWLGVRGRAATLSRGEINKEEFEVRRRSELIQTSNHAEEVLWNLNLPPLVLQWEFRDRVCARWDNEDESKQNQNPARALRSRRKLWLKNSTQT